MKTLHSLAATLVGICLLTLTTQSAFAQFSVGINGSAAFSDVKNSDTFYGGGLNAKIFPSSKLAIGVGVKAFGEKYDFSVANQNFQYTSSIIPITAMLDYYLSDGFLRPYVGVDAGVYATGYRIKFNGQESSKISSTNAGAAPKIGLMLALGNLGIFAEGAYNFIFGNKDGSVNLGGVNNISFDNTSKFFTVNVGVQIGVPSSK